MGEGWGEGVMGGWGEGLMGEGWGEGGQPIAFRTTPQIDLFPKRT